MRLRWLLVGLLFTALIVPALMITGVRVAEPASGRLIRLVSFTPYAMLLYAAALLLALLVLVVGRGAWRKAGGVAAALTLLLLGLHAYWLSSLYAGQGAVADGPRLTVLAANLLRGRADVDRVMELAETRDADVMVVSEITPEALERLEAAGVDEVFADSAGEPAAGVGGTMLFTTGAIAGVERLPTVLGGYSARARIPGVGAVRVLAVHPSPPFGDAAEWKRDHAVVRRHLTAQESGAPVIVAGDFNATLDHAPLRQLRDLGFRDAAEQANAGLQPTWPASGVRSVLGVPLPPMLQIDHVLTGDSLGAVRTESIPLDGSDHHVLVAELVRP